jgi:hypothetical protein
VFFLLCVIAAGVFGAATANIRILYAQAVPGIIALGHCSRLGKSPDSPLIPAQRRNADLELRFRGQRRIAHCSPLVTF